MSCYMSIEFNYLNSNLAFKRKLGEQNIEHFPLVNRDRIKMPRLHKQLGITMQFSKTLETIGDSLGYSAY